MNEYLTLVPAYGRDYKSKKAVIADWEAGKDFQIMDISSPYDGGYITKKEAEASIKGTILHIRYKQLMNICEIKVPK